MGCNCGKNRGRRSRTRELRPTSGPVQNATNNGVAAGAGPAELRALNILKTTGPRPGRRVNAERKRIDRLRRAAIQKSLNK